MPDAPAMPSKHPSGLPYRAGVGVMLLNDRDEVFVGQRLDSTLEAWQMPQGGIDADEDPRAAAFRELEEETGIRRDLAEPIAESRDWLCYDLPDDLIGKIWKGKYCGQRQKWYAMRFLGRDADVNLRTAHPEFRAWKWATAAELPSLIVPFKRDLYTAVLEEFAELLPR
jgi:putative (di)nucleoside polyphosphate hydrolase